jgi:hypothetical protein
MEMILRTEDNNRETMAVVFQPVVATQRHIHKHITDIALHTPQKLLTFNS